MAGNGMGGGDRDTMRPLMPPFHFWPRPTSVPPGIITAYNDSTVQILRNRIIVFCNAVQRNYCTLDNSPQTHLGSVARSKQLKNIERQRWARTAKENNWYRDMRKKKLSTLLLWSGCSGNKTDSFARRKVNAEVARASRLITRGSQNPISSIQEIWGLQLELQN